MLTHKLSEMLRRVHIKYPRKVVTQMLINNGEIIHDLVKSNLDSFRENKVGGGKIETKKLKYKFGKYTFTLFLDIEDGEPSIAIYPDNNTENPNYCLHILFNSAEKIAYIDNISYYPECVDVGLEYPGGGSILLKMAIQYLKENKDKLKINKIQLKDNSFMSCESINNKIRLSSLMMLTHGNTWYTNHGFIPYNYVEKAPDTDKMIKYKVNQKLVRKMKLKCTNIQNIIERAISENKLEKYINLIEFRKLCKKYDDQPIKVFFKDFLAHPKFTETCTVFYYTYLDIMKDIGLYDLHGLSYYMQI